MAMPEVFGNLALILRFGVPMELQKQINAQQTQEAWHALDADHALNLFATPADQGLGNTEAARRLESYGPNQLAEAPPTTIWQMLWEQFNNFVVILLVVAAIISALLGDYVEAGAILAIVVLNAVLGIVQERRAEQALAALRKLAAPEANILRDGRRITSAPVSTWRYCLPGSGQLYPCGCTPDRCGQSAN